MPVSLSLFSGFSSVGTVPAGSLSKAALSGANTVKGPLPCSVSTRPAALTAATSGVWSFELTAFSMMFLLGNIGAPPTVTGFCAKALLESSVTSANKLNAKNFVMLSLFLVIRNLNSCFQEPVLFVFHQIYGRSGRFGLVAGAFPVSVSITQSSALNG